VSSSGSRFRKLLDAGRLVIPGVFNAITAKLAVRAGFDALYMSGAGVTNALTGFPDVALLTLTEMAEQSRYICNAVDAPVIADADTGYGGVLNVARAVREFERAGVAGIHIEDQVAPKRCGHLAGKQLIAPRDMAAKIAAAVQAREDPDFFVIARTDARGVTGLDDAVERARRYRDAGADAIFPESLRSKEEFAEFAGRVEAPLLANMTEFGQTPTIPAEEFHRLGYEMVIFPMTAFRVMMKGAEQVYADLFRSGTQAGFLDRMQTRRELYELIGYADYEELDQAISSQFEE
jgi:methylisocitrate lyase